jgi:Tfp pilus assembly protein PilV
MLKQTHARTSRGVGVIEALVSLLVLALGMMSFAALQSRLRLNSDVSKQRAEAVRIAQEDIENFRAFGTMAADGTVANNFAFNSIATGSATKTVLSSVTTTTNAAYTVTRTVTDSSIAAGLTEAPIKNLTVTVAWTDRTSSAQSVTLRSVISKSDPAIAASLALPANGSPARDLLGRDIQVPIPAKNLGNGTSAIKPIAAGSVAYVFNNDTGIVTQRCTDNTGFNTLGQSVTSSLTLATLASANVTCTSTFAYLVSGFISNASFNALPGNFAVRTDLSNTAPPGGAQGTTAQLTAAYWPTISSATGSQIGTGATTYTTPECNAEALQTITYTSPVSYTQTNNGSTTTKTSAVFNAIIPQSVTSITPSNVAPWVGVSAANASTTILSPQATGELFVGYSCLVYPIDLDLNGATAAAYTARTALWPATGSSWAIGTTNSTYKICRFSGDFNNNGSSYVTSGSNVTGIDNQEHNYAYLNVQKSLSNQNFKVIAGNSSCSSGSSEVLHQP